MKRIVPIVLAVIAVTAWADDLSVFQDAERRFATGEYGLAGERYHDLIDEYPDSPLVGQSWLRIGQSQYSLGSLEQALLTFKRVAVRYLSDTVQDSVYLWLGLCEFRLERYGEAEEAFDTHLNGKPTDPALAALYRGLTREKRSDLFGAEADLRVALDSPLYPAAMAHLLSLYARQSRYTDSIDLWSTAGIRLPGQDPYREAILRFVADAAFEAGVVNLAEELYNELTALGTDNAQWAFFRLYLITEERGGDARDVYRRAEQRLAAEPARLAEFWYDLGRSSYEAGRLQIAELYLRRLWDLRTGQSVPGQAILYLAYALDGQERSAEAAEIIEESLSFDFDVENERRVFLGELHLRNGDPLRARDALDPALQSSGIAAEPIYERLVYLSATARIESGKTADALSLVRTDRFNAASVESQQLARQRAWLFLATGDAERAVRAYREYLSVYPEDASARRELIRALLGAGEPAAAYREGNAALGGDPDAELRYYTGLAAFELARYPEARDLLTEARARGIRTALLDYHLMWTLYRSGMIAESLEVAQTMDRAALPSALTFQVTYLQSFMLFRGGRNADAATGLVALVSRELEAGQDMQVRRLLAKVYREEGAYEEALDQYREMLLLSTSDGESAEIWREYGRLLELAGYRDQAIEELLNLHIRFGDTAAGEGALMDAATVYFSEDRFQEARDLFRLYRSEYPGGLFLDEALYRAGFSSLELGEPAAALLWWEPLIRTRPESPWVPRTMLAVALIYEERGQLRRALETAEGLIARYPDAPETDEAGLLRRRWRLELDGFSRREAELWAELDETSPPAGSDRWFSLILELGRITIREQITLSSGRAGIVDYLRQARTFADRTEAAEAGILLGEYYQRQAEFRSAIEAYLSVAELPGANDDQRAQSLYQVVLISSSRQQDRETADLAAAQLKSLYPESIWSQRLSTPVGGDHE